MCILNGYWEPAIISKPNRIYPQNVHTMLSGWTTLIISKMLNYFIKIYYWHWKWCQSQTDVNKSVLGKSAHRIPLLTEASILNPSPFRLNNTELSCQISRQNSHLSVSINILISSSDQLKIPFSFQWIKLPFLDSWTLTE